MTDPSEGRPDEHPAVTSRPPCTCPTGGTFYGIAAAWAIWVAVTRRPETARSFDADELASLRSLPGLKSISADDLQDAPLTARADLAEYDRLLKAIASCLDHGLRGAPARRYFNRQNGEEWFLARVPGPRGVFRLHPTGRSIVPLVDRARRAAMLARDSILQDPGPVREDDLADLKMCRAGVAEYKGSPDDPIQRGTLVKANRLLWHVCGRTRFCPQCQTERALHHFRGFLFAARWQIKAARTAGNTLGIRSFTSDAASAREFVERLPAVAIRIQRPRSRRVTVIYVGRTDGLGERVEGDDALWTLFEPPSIAAFVGIKGEGWGDPDVIARLGLPAGTRLYRHHDPHVPGAVEIAGILGLEVPHSAVHSRAQAYTAVCGTPVSKQARAKARKLAAGWLGFEPNAPLPDPELLRVVADVESQVGLARPPRQIRRALTVALAEPDVSSFKRGRFDGRVSHLLRPPRKVSAPMRNIRALRRNVASIELPTVVGETPELPDLLRRRLGAIDNARAALSSALLDEVEVAIPIHGLELEVPRHLIATACRHI